LCTKFLVVDPVGWRQIGRPRRSLEDIRMILSEIGCGRDWIILAQDRDRWRALVDTVIKLRMCCVTGVFLRRAQIHGIIKK
jgi:hypothetical protein